MTDRRAQILDAVRSLLAEGGDDAVSVRRVAERAGIGASTLRHYFPTQRELFRAALEDAVEGAVQDLRIADRRVDPTTRLTECVMQYFPASRDQITVLAAALTLTADGVGHHATDAGRARYGLAREMSMEVLTRWTSTLAEQGALRVEPRPAALLLSAVIDGLATVLLADPEVTIEDVEAQIRDVVARVIVAS